MQRRSLFAISIALVVCLWSVGGVWSAETRTFVDAAGRKVEVPIAVNRVMASGPPASVLLYVLAPDKMAGWVRPLSAEEKAFIAEAYRELPVTGRLTGKESNADAETVRKIKPDLILDVGTVDAEYATLADRIQKETGVPYILLDGSLAKTAETLHTLGKLLGKEADASVLADYAENTIGRSEVDPLNPPPVILRLSVYYGRGKDGLETLGSDSINMEILGALDFSFIPGGAGGPHKMTAAEIIGWNPDVIVTLNTGFAETVMKDPAWSHVTAVQNKRVFCSPMLPFGWIDSPPGINRLLGLKWLRAVVYPFNAKGDLREVVRDFYRLFYHVELTDGQAGELLNGCAIN